MEQLLFLALLAVVGLVRWFSQMAEDRRNREAEKRTGPPPPNATVPRAPAETEEERIRRFMEALGVPTSNAPIPRAEAKPAAPAAPKQSAPPTKRSTMPIDPFPVPRGRMPTPPVVVAPPPLPQQPTPRAPAPPALEPPRPSIAPTATPLPTRETTVFADAPPRRARNTSGADFEVRDLTDAAEEIAGPASSASGRGPARPASSLASRLATAEGLREAIVLREIFGPPRSMQPVDPAQR
ncbi:MAG: hypothetical protein AVDCRST_MAG42-2002 [uncultured Chthoniobacterales bacterium]|uniref:Uncharacterized protein n=1 Tax=uncultured Chthoniobacterales bacterium TaxID=1836801 RepID=A0A6J4ICS4_9BACT|nr:MAG: hypothetical protein AVDCRST_MAG42-2002 [uncultured Chthoniobacterales bacterium]